MRGLQSRSICLWTAGMLLLCFPLMAQTEVNLSATGLDIQTKTNFEKAFLTISGPGDIYMQKAFEPGASLYFGLFDEADTALPDGSYNFQLTLAPALSQGLRQKVEALRDRNEINIQRKGKVISGSFTVKDSQIVSDRVQEIQTKDQQFLDDVIVVGSICAGQDCVNGESFGFDTLRLKENNLRIKFQDTSNSASFPSNDWQLTANDSSNGGANKFSIDDIDGGRTPFTIEASAPTNSLFVDDGGRVGFGTSTPVANLHVVEGNTPTLRLEQDGSNGFTPQTWDMAGNEANFFIRDATNGSKLPVQIKPGAPTASIFVEADGDIGLSTASPEAALQVRRTNGTARVHVEDTSTGTTQLLRLESAGQPRMTFNITSGQTWHHQMTSSISSLQWINTSDVTAGAEMELTADGNLSVQGTLTVGGTMVNVPDYVFSPLYELMPLKEVEDFITSNHHLPNVPPATEIQESGLNMTDMQLRLLEKVEELTLYTIEQHNTIAELQARLEALEGSETVEN